VIITLSKIKDKVFHVHFIKAYRRTIGIPPFIVKLSQMQWSTSSPGRFVNRRLGETES
jgi:hypothetical protein